LSPLPENQSQHTPPIQPQTPPFLHVQDLYSSSRQSPQYMSQTPYGPHVQDIYSSTQSTQYSTSMQPHTFHQDAMYTSGINSLDTSLASADTDIQPRQRHKTQRVHNSRFSRTFEDRLLDLLDKDKEAGKTKDELRDDVKHKLLEEKELEIQSLKQQVLVVQKEKEEIAKLDKKKRKEKEKKEREENFFQDIRKFLHNEFSTKLDTLHAQMAQCHDNMGRRGALPQNLFGPENPTVVFVVPKNQSFINTLARGSSMLPTPTPTTLHPPPHSGMLPYI